MAVRPGTAETEPQGSDTDCADARDSPARFSYRPALDGLRSVAVYLVVLFHAQLSHVAGGFIGVDVFFVLSGFLITNILVAEHAGSGRIALTRFYARRVRRLLPAAILAIVGTAALSTLIYPQFTRSAWVRDGQAAAIYVSNWHFIREARDYFAEDIGQSPYLHFWSLSIEEQFYLGFPLVLLCLLRLAARWNHHWIPAVGLMTVAALSLTMQFIVASGDPTRAYYGTETRIYQMACGAVAALIVARRVPTMERVRLHSFLAPLGLLALALLATDLVDLTPSHRGMLATVAAVATIVGLDRAPCSTLADLLSRPTLVYLGRISYGTYLWHWPVILVVLTVFDATSVEVAAISAVVATALASLSYHLVEMPIRNGGR